jgi:hypothetical protein
MKHRFLTQNRRFLKLCSDMARFYGVLCLILAGVVVLFAILAVSGSMGAEHRTRWLTTFQPFTRIPIVALRGLLALVVAEFISYLIADEGKPKWLLRHGDKIIYAYAIFLLVPAIRTGFFPPAGSAVDHSSNLGFGLIGLLSTAAVVLMWVGIGITLRKVLPIIRESKTLV